MFYDFTTLNSERTSLIFSRLYLQTFSLFQFYAWLVPFHGRPGRYNQTEKNDIITRTPPELQKPQKKIVSYDESRQKILPITTVTFRR